MNDLMRENIERNVESLATPIVAFVTFKSQEGYERCSKHLFENTRRKKKSNRANQFQLWGEKAQIKAAPEPSNIIWENL